MPSGRVVVIGPAWPLTTARGARRSARVTDHGRVGEKCPDVVGADIPLARCRLGTDVIRPQLLAPPRVPTRRRDDRPSRRRVPAR